MGLLTPTTSYSQTLGNDLILKSVGTLDDVERLAVFNEAIHGHGVGSMTRNLILYHPHTRPEHWLYIEDESTPARDIVSSLCLLPWRWRYEDVELRVGEMGICGTKEEFRNRGLVRALMLRHKALLHEGEYHLSQIQGIPYFYRQFGYEYALPLEGGWRLDLYNVRDDAAEGSTLRAATVADIPLLMQLYSATASELDISARRDESEWRYMRKLPWLPKPGFWSTRRANQKRTVLFNFSVLELA
jgi:hypothetical protein